MYDAAKAHVSFQSTQMMSMADRTLQKPYTGLQVLLFVDADEYENQIADQIEPGMSSLLWKITDVNQHASMPSLRLPTSEEA
jgi:hypothetical protein